MANWLEHYAEALELNVWTSTTVTKAIQNTDTFKWNVTVSRNGKERSLVVKHIIFATGIGSDVPRFPEIPGKVSISISKSDLNNPPDFHAGEIQRDRPALVSAQDSQGP